MNRQLALALQLNGEATLRNFCWGDNALLRAPLESLMHGGSEPCISLWGSAGCGKTHLLQAACNAVTAPRTAAFLPLSLLKPFGPDALDGMEHQDVIAVDDLQSIAGEPDWEEALFHLYNRMRAREGSGMLFASSLPPRGLGIRLPDLVSRLGAGLVVHLKPLSDEEKSRTLQKHAELRGFHLPLPAARFLLNHCTRDMHALTHLLDRLDEASLAAQRRITVPFVKTLLSL